MGRQPGAFRVFASTDQRMPVAQLAAHARRAEALGFDGLNVPDQPAPRATHNEAEKYEEGNRAENPE